MKIFEKVYNNSPIFLQNFIVTIVGYAKNRQRYGKVYDEYRMFLIDFDTWSIEKKIDYQNQELIKFIEYVNEKSPFYKKLYADIDISLLKTTAGLKMLPIVDKEMLRQNMENVITIPKKGAVQEKTGGTTGKSLTIFRTTEDMMKRMAMLDHFKARIGFENRKMKRATFNAKPIVPPNQKQKIYWRYNAANKQMIYTPFHLSEDNIKYYVHSLNKFKPCSLDGYFTALCDIALYIERNNLSLTFTPLAIFPTSEKVTASGCQLLERVFKCKVYDQYASSEGAPFVTTCNHQTLHVELASGIFEQFEEDSHEVLVTSFTSHGTPLIRYRIGDAMVFADRASSICTCGMQTPIVKEIWGRKNDFLYTAKGVKVNAANVANLFKNLGNSVIRAQTIQNKLDEVVILLETDKTKYKSEYDNLLIEEFHRRFGFDTHVLINHVKTIPREKSGKFRLIKNNVEISN